MNNQFVCNLKNIFSFILKSIVLILLCVCLSIPFFGITLLFTYAYAYVLLLFNINNENIPIFFLTGVTVQIIQIAIYYFISKKIGIIKVFDKMPLWCLLFIFLIYEFLIVGFVWSGYNGKSYFFDNPLSLDSVKKLADFSILGFGYLYTFLTYLIIRFLRKYPERFNRNKKIHSKN